LKYGESGLAPEGMERVIKTGRTTEKEGKRQTRKEGGTSTGKAGGSDRA